MGTLEEIRQSFGEEFFTAKRERPSAHSWYDLCVCGHLDRYHSQSVGGAYREPLSGAATVGGREVTRTFVFDGCCGALVSRGVEKETVTVDRDESTVRTEITVTCPCTELRAVAKVDRPNRFFNQRVPTDREDPLRHPFMVGIRAFTTHLSKRRMALSDPTWVDREFERRFVWLDGKRHCEISRCTVIGDGVWPVFVDGELSELRCPEHR